MPEQTIVLSVIVPIHRVEQYLPYCIESLIGQTYRNMEIILVNDGSPDACKQICDEYAGLDSRIVVIHKQNEGLVSARKAGLQAARGEYIGYVDGDDWVETTMYEELMDCAIKSGADIVAAGHKEELNGLVVEVLLNSLPCGFYNKESLKKEVYPFMISSGAFSHFGIFSYLWNKVFKKDILYPNQMAIDNRIFMAEDAACTYPALLDADSLYITDATSYHYRQRVDSMVKSRLVNYSELERYNLLYKHLYQKFISSPFSNVLLPQLDLFLLSLLTVRSNLDFMNIGKVNELFAFKEIPHSADIVVCGAGTFGQHLVRRINQNNNFNLILWIDSLFSVYKELGLEVKSLSEVVGKSYHYILVAYINEIHAEKIRNELIQLGVSPEKVLLVRHFLDYPVKSLLKGFGLNIDYE